MKSKKYCNESHEIKSIIINTLYKTLEYILFYLQRPSVHDWLHSREVDSQHQHDD